MQCHWPNAISHLQYIAYAVRIFRFFLCYPLQNWLDLWRCNNWFRIHKWIFNLQRWSSYKSIFVSHYRLPIPNSNQYGNSRYVLGLDSHHQQVKKLYRYSYRAFAKIPMLFTTHELTNQQFRLFFKKKTIFMFWIQNQLCHFQGAD